MKLHMYSIYDRASGVYDRPFVGQTDAAAQRSFSDVALDKSHPIGKHPGDFTLMRLGSWNDNTGKIEGCMPEKVANGLECVAAAEKVLSKGNAQVVGAVKNGLDGDGYPTNGGLRDGS